MMFMVSSGLGLYNNSSLCIYPAMAPTLWRKKYIILSDWALKEDGNFPHFISGVGGPCFLSLPTTFRTRWDSRSARLQGTSGWLHCWFRHNCTACTTSYRPLSFYALSSLYQMLRGCRYLIYLVSHIREECRGQSSPISVLPTGTHNLKFGTEAGAL
jgi:hypothetical protein